MNRFRWFIAVLPFMLALMFMPETIANSCGILPSSLLSSTSYCIPISIASSSASSNAQVMLTFNALNYSSYLASNLMNIYVYNKSSGIATFAYIEGNVLNEQQTSSLNTVANVIIWLNGSSYPISTAIDSNFAIGVGATTTDFLGNTNAKIGTAPQLSSTYGAVDNGANVFSAYCGFAGTSLCSGWTSATNGGTVSINNGVSITSAGSQNGGAYIESTSKTPANEIVDSYISSYSVSAGSYGRIGDIIGYTGTTSTSTGCLVCGTGAYGYEFDFGYNLGNDGSTTIQISSSSVGTAKAYSYPSAPLIFSGAWYSGNEALEFGYQSQLTWTDTGQTLQTVYIGLGAMGASGLTTQVSADWVRGRLSPPSSIMPITTTGATFLPSKAILSITPNPSNYGQSITLQATCLSGDTCSIDYPSIGTHLATGTGTATYTYAAGSLKAGAYSSYYANDISGGLDSSGYTLTVNKGQLTYSLNNCTNEVWTITSGYSCTTMGQFSYAPNQILAKQQVTANLDLNNVLLSSTNSIINTTSNTIANSILQACYTFSNAATANFIAGNALPVCWYGYTPFIAYNGSLKITNTPTGNILTKSSIPWEFYTQSPSNTISFWFGNTLNGGAFDMLQSNVLNVSYIAYQISTGNYLFTVNEMQPNNPLSSNIPITENLTTFNGVLLSSATSCQPNSPNSPLIQYFPVLFNGIIRSCFNNAPSNFLINNFINSTTPSAPFLDVKGSGSTTLNINMKVVYPFISFNLTSAMGLSTASLSLTSYCQTASNSIPASPCTRVIFNISTYDQRTLNPLITQTNSTFCELINNYTIPCRNLGFSNANTFKIYTSQNPYTPQNPNIFLSNISTLSSAVSHYQSLNNYFSGVLNATTWRTFKIYLADSNASLYTFQIYQGASYGGIGDLMNVQILSGGGTLQSVQYYKITTVPFQLPLENGESYRFLFYNSQQALIYTSATSIWSSPIVIYLPVNVSVPIYYLPKANATCSGFPAKLPTVKYPYVICQGNDPQNYVSSWTILVNNITSILGVTQVLNETNLTGSSFSWKYNLTRNGTVYKILVLGHIGTTLDPTYTFASWVSNYSTRIVPIAAGGAILALFLFLAMIMLGSSNKSVMLLFMDFALFVGAALNLFAMSYIVVLGIYVFSAVMIFMFETDRL